ncbi:RNA-binding region RNP-1 domain-containing protein [Reticulomyxa filosa]|uniref:RNA-binding region RNP-1 domain-containing protein n=1 Tax=Reticulomyxa filosa TaxID=46433 RepID=X6M7G4_RETFI|nr:RNA-binding region RNP-1 domain-containing protein [Reticulomyxa filosa]|eukprot:ETO08975.1 RNA-binding region RNP-1 domain-containing protein [Reticulomyxa filosa]
MYSSNSNDLNDSALALSLSAVANEKCNDNQSETQKIHKNEEKENSNNENSNNENSNSENSNSENNNNNNNNNNDNDQNEKSENTNVENKDIAKNKSEPTTENNNLKDYLKSNYQTPCISTDENLKRTKTTQLK